MPSDRWRRVQELFERLETVEPSERLSCLERLEPDPALRQETLRLLDAARQEEEASIRLKPPTEPAPLPGPFANLTLLSPLGSGGFSTVYSAIRCVNGAEQRVAVKLFHAHHVGPEARRRFEREQKVLASFNHPGIVRFLDAGAASTGQPYLVMEEVEGSTILEHADRFSLSIPARLRLVAGACNALQEAHRHLLVHLDLKPSNILVTTEGQVKLLDFGTAKLLDDTTGAATFTQQLTPLYASPERLRGEPGSVSSDVYSLGLVLYELLTGAWPFDDRESMAAIAARAHGARGIPLSAAMCTPQAAATRGTTVERLSGVLRGDLQAICAKALAYEPAERYASIAEFNEDIRRYLAGEPVSAHPPGVLYRAGKFVRRNGRAIALAAVAAAALLSAAGYAWMQRIESLQRMQEARAMANYLLFDLYDRVNNLPGSTAVRAHMAAQAQAQLDRLSRLAGAGLDLRLEAAAGYNRLAEIQAVSGSSSLGQLEAASQNLDRARYLLGGILSERPSYRSALLEDARNALLSAKLHNWNRRNTAAARPLIERATVQLEKAKDSSDSEWLRIRSSLAVQRADLAEFDQNYGEERSIAASALAEMDGWPARLREDGDFVLRRTALLKRRGNSSYHQDLFAEALASYKEAHDLLASFDARQPNRPEVLYSLMDMSYQMAYCYGELKQPQAMLDSTRRSLEIGRELLDHDPANRALARSYWNKRQALAESLAALEQFSDALREQETVLQARKAALRDQPGSNLAREDVLISEATLAEILAAAGQLEHACPLARGSRERAQALHASGGMTAKNWTWQQRQLDRVLAQCPAR
jgi:hypothetical protein